jgi:hypothetical protein
MLLCFVTTRAIRGRAIPRRLPHEVGSGWRCRGWQQGSKARQSVGASFFEVAFTHIEPQFGIIIVRIKPGPRGRIGRRGFRSSSGCSRLLLTDNRPDNEFHSTDLAAASRRSKARSW